ncbi:hypothetical protein HYY71_06220 [Candidatus Woesearchaeota archaeon]|nr:hypothetical protein [Candidatus Woesearchaeota archaeon]
MKCVMCNKGTLKETNVEYKEYRVLLGKYKASVCTKCEEAFFDTETAKKIQVKSKELGLLGLAKRQKWLKLAIA